MTSLITEEGKDDLLSRGYSRRHMLRTAMILGGASVLPAFNPERVRAAPASAKNMVLIGGNECWTGPFASGVAAGSAYISKSNRYMPNDEHGDFIRAVAKMEEVPEDHVSTW